MAEFVTKSIDNASNGVTVKDAIEYLKLTRCVYLRATQNDADTFLCSKQDYMPGMEVRLLPHQIIGCAWYVSRNIPYAGVNGFCQDATTRARKAIQRWSPR